ncbi:type II toxin-antitoxin system RelB/DinJ family antitoxin [Candidatus Nomurabacteria bacterium]|nr:type II toxin-antitoxin system RelB/DinJ family antitoxin [Candidatus Nomurabacteria bacterium]
MSTVTIRIDEQLKKKAQKTLEKQGLDMSTAIKMFFKQVVFEKGLPFLPTHNEEVLRRRWDAQVQDALQNGKAYSSFQEMIDDMKN